MLNITQLNASLLMQPTHEAGESRHHLGIISPPASRLPLASTHTKPTVTWRISESCNLIKASHDSPSRLPGLELNTAEGGTLIADLAAYQVPRLVFEGGEPLMRADLFELMAYACKLGIQPALLTNGTLLSPDMVKSLKRAGACSVSILIEAFNLEADRNRGTRRAFDAAMEGYANSQAAGLETEIRTPLNRHNYFDLAEILNFIEGRKIRKVVFAHLVYTGRGNDAQHDLTHEEKRRAIDLILERVEDFARRGVDIKIATDENHADGIYFYLRSARRNPLRAAAVYPLLQGGGGDVTGAGVGLAGIDSVGNVHPDPYWANSILGNVRQAPFSEIWEKSPDPLLRGLRDRLPLLKGRCANCRWKQTCGGNLRVRAEEYFGDPWTTDPACYLTNKEISKEVIERAGVMADDVLLSRQAA